MLDRITRKTLLGAWAALALASCAHAPEAAAPAARVVVSGFAVGAPEQAAAIWTAEDEFMAVVTPADISIRTRSADGARADLIRAYAGAFEPWTDEERARLEAMLTRRAPQLQAIARWLPETVLIVKSNGAADTALPHTRGAAINMGQRLPTSDEGLDGLFFHELFHVLSRHNAARHDEMYGLIGFAPCSITLPDDVMARTLTNPDAPLMRHAAPLGSDGRYVFTVLFAEPTRYDPAKPAFGAYLQMRFAVASQDASGRCALNLSSGQQLTEVSQEEAAAAFYAAAGHNTEYILHPEELLADNFAELMMGETVPNPEVHARLAAFLGIPAPAGAN